MQIHEKNFEANYQNFREIVIFFVIIPSFIGESNKTIKMDARAEIDEVLICPYDKNHRIARSRIQRHLVKCEKNYHKNDKVTCPYDATHRISKNDFVNHVEKCPMKTAYINIHADRRTIKLPDTYDVDDSHIVEADESWDDDDVPAFDVRKIEPDFSEFNQNKYTTTGCIRGAAHVPKRYDVKLRPPHGFSESMMLDFDGSAVNSSILSEDLDNIDSPIIGEVQSKVPNTPCQYMQSSRGGIRGRIFRSRILH